MLVLAGRAGGLKSLSVAKGHAREPWLGHAKGTGPAAAVATAVTKRGNCATSCDRGCSDGTQKTWRGSASRLDEAATDAASGPGQR